MCLTGAGVFDPMETAAKAAGNVCHASTPALDGFQGYFIYRMYHQKSV